MATTRSLSPAARARLRRGYLMGGAVLAAAWVAITVSIGVDGGAEAAAGSQVLLVIFSAPAAALIALGLLAERSARRYDAVDAAFADAIETSLDQLVRLPRAAAFELDAELPELRATRLLEVDRPIDATTAEGVIEALEQQLGSFPPALTAAYGPAPQPTRPDRPLSRPAGAVHDLLSAPFPISGGTQRQLAAATEVTAEPVGSAGTGAIRWITVPAPGVEGWLRDLLEQVAHVLGGGTHASATVMSRRAALVERFGAEPDLSALEDQLAGLVTSAAPNQILVRGPMLGAETWLATSLRLGADKPLLLWPSGFPTLLGRALGESAREAERR